MFIFLQLTFAYMFPIALQFRELNFALEGVKLNLSHYELHIHLIHLLLLFCCLPLLSKMLKFCLQNKCYISLFYLMSSIALKCFIEVVMPVA